MARGVGPLTYITAAAVTVAIVAMAAGSQIRSPDEVARSRQAPEPSLITAPVERKVLNSTVVIRGDVRLSSSTEVLADSGIGPATGSGEAGTPVVTGRVPAEGTELNEGGVAVEVSGRPVLLLRGDLPMYRSLRPGHRGADVRQLEAALARLGHSPGTVDDLYDNATAQAVSAWYKASGYEPVQPTPEERERVEAARGEVSSARAAKRQADAALAQAKAPPAPSALRAARDQVEQAAGQLELAKQRRTDEIAKAPPEDKERVRLEQNLLVRQAESQLESAQAALTELTRPPNTSSQQQAVTEAQAAVRDAENRLAAMEKEYGVKLPRGEVVFVPDLPRRVQGVKAALGARPEGALMTLIGGEPQVDGELSPANQRLVQAGGKVELDEPSLGAPVPGEVSYVAERPGTDGAAAGMHRIRIRPTGGDPRAMLGLNVRVSIPIASTEGAVLAVPVSALYTASDGKVRVRVVRDGSIEDVEVQPGLVANGFAELKSVDGTLQADDPVVVGQR
ncbi:peptidoglycan-binding protein [Kibdelosporangium aridum]|uniref:peptidoglycan-binding protein n=1 Tax=Kibdelosporangium aridum TaxID=2030 RepID=UPI0035EF5452